MPTQPSLVVRKFRDSRMMGAVSPLSPGASTLPFKAEAPTISCNFEMQVPMDALRIHATILVSTTGDANEAWNNGRRPSISYKITICTPRNSNSNVPQIRRNDDGSITTTTTTATLRWTSRFTPAKGRHARDSFYEWSGMFALGNKKPIALAECSFQQLTGTIQGPNARRNTESISPPVFQDATKRHLQEDAADLQAKKRRRVQTKRHIPASSATETELPRVVL
eukprot:CAMPEP_0172363860 /NCGR_PEP_ID=MMETSP1060-20121228/7102_1 /TAXON_ID=37318 /ORGANISM="Pseudo-nitzschia pungens, Strain cf. cingulata" /LENGTH=223 /DNA_ID=CAMNT_0013086699 /DNA_START=45 /DNA_END=716 /DNA_ORIENTATION=-